VACSRVKFTIFFTFTFVTLCVPLTDKILFAHVSTEIIALRVLILHIYINTSVSKVHAASVFMIED